MLRILCHDIVASMNRNLICSGTQFLVLSIERASFKNADLTDKVGGRGRCRRLLDVEDVDIWEGERLAESPMERE
jgi:hypothetical protein